MTKKHSGQDGKGESDDRLMQLFWNRAALKKEFQRLREQRYRLEETLKQQQAATLSAESRIDSLAKLFANPDAGFNAIVYYQFRNLWNTSSAELMKFAAELHRKREDKERQREVMAFNRNRSQRLAKLAETMQGMITEISRLQAQIKELHAKMESMHGILGFFKRRPLQAQIMAANAKLEPVSSQYDELNSKQSRIAAETPPEFQGVGIAGKRLTNLAVIALAQHMHDYYSKSGLASQARDAVIMPIEETRYGTKGQCTKLMELIPSTMAGLKSDPVFSSRLKQSAESLIAAAEFLTEEDTIPRADSLDKVVLNPSGGRSASCNVLAQDFWDVYSALIR
mgnify:CR=1 FL=1